MIARRQAPTTVANASGPVPANIDDFTRDWPTDQIERLSVSSLVPCARNARHIPSLKLHSSRLTFVSGAGLFR